MSEPASISRGCRWALTVRTCAEGGLSTDMKKLVRGHLLDCDACRATFGDALERAVVAESERPSWWRASGRAIAGAARRLVTWIGGSNA